MGRIEPGRYDRVLCVVLAGGQGSRLGPLTEGRSKPSLRVGGHYRLIDVALSNIANSALRDVFVVEQFEPHLLNDHLAGGRPWDLDRSRGGLRVLPPYESDRNDQDGFADGNAEALWRNSAVIDEVDPEAVIVVSADHLYRLDLRDVLDHHAEADVAATVVTAELDDGEDLTRFTVVDVDAGRVRDLDYKPDHPSGRVVATEVFVYDWAALRDRLDDLAGDDEPLGDYGERLLPSFVDDGGIAAFAQQGLWADLGVPQTYLDAQLALLDGHPGFSFHDQRWPIHSADTDRRPARVHAPARIDSSWICAGADVAGRVVRSIIGPGAVVEAGAEVRDCVIMDDVVIGAGASVAATVAAEAVEIEAGAQVGSPGHEGPVLIGARARIAGGETVSPGTEVAGAAARSTR